MLKFNTLFYRIKYIFIISSIYIFSALLNATSNLERLNAPPGFEINIFADGLESPRQITETDGGFIIVGSKMGDKIIGLFDSDDDGFAEKRIVIADNLKNPNYKRFKEEKIFDYENPFKVKSIDGYSMLLNFTKIKMIKDFNFFDENFFLYLENDDLCLRLTRLNENIYIIPKSKINHLGGKTVDPKYKYEIELSRNWHWMWSKFYYNKKHSGFLLSTIKIFPNFLSAIIKYIFYLLLFKNQKRNIYKMRLLGIINAIIGKKSFYRID